MPELIKNLTTFAKDVAEGFKALHLLARIVKVGPPHMITLSKHAAYNTSAISIVAIMLVISINIFSPSPPIGLVTGFVATLSGLFLVGIVGFVVNLAAPADKIFKDTDEIVSQSESEVQKWATYLIINIFCLILIFYIVNLTAILISDKIIVNMMAIEGFPVLFSQIFVTLLCSLSATALVYVVCYKAGKIVDNIRAAAIYYIITNLVAFSFFYFFNYILFVKIF